MTMVYRDKMYERSIDRMTGSLFRRVMMQKLPMINVVIKESVSTRLLNHSGIDSCHWLAKMLSFNLLRHC